MKTLLHHWVTWAFLVSAVVLWGLPQLPYYQEGLPYLYDLGGSALVAFYLFLGCLSVCLAVGVRVWLGSATESLQINIHKKIVFWFGALAAGCLAIYFVLMNLSVNLG